VAVRVDRDERPDVADLVRLSLVTLSDVVDEDPDAAAWLALTPEGRPIAGASMRSSPPTRDSLAGIADAYRERRGEVEARAGAAAARIVSAQASEPPRGALDGAVVARALRGVRDSTGAATLPGPIRLLLAEHARAATTDSGRALAQALDSLARAAGTPHSLVNESLHLRALVEGHAAVYRDAAETVAARLERAPRDEAGAFMMTAADRRVFAFANGLAIGALALSASALEREADGREAARAAEAVIQRLGPWPSLARCTGVAGRCGAAFLEDYAFLIEGLLDLQEATNDARWRDEAVAAAEAAIARFLDVSVGGFFDTDAAHAPLPARLRDGYDGARPSANGVMATVLQRLARETGERRYAELARATIQSFLGDLQRAPKGMESLAAAAAVMLGEPDRPVAAEASRPSREERGPVTVEASLSAAKARPSGALEARIRLVMAEGWTINGPRPAAGLVPLTISAPGIHLLTSPVRFPEGGAYQGEATVVVPLRVRPTAPPGSAPARLSVRFQACRGNRCEAPESVILEVPFEVEAGRR
jgi:uncharacterized protein YyaL (SSP411 family)